MTTDVWTKLVANSYRNKNPYPEHPRKPVIRANATPDEFRRHASNLEKYDEEMKVYREKLAHYNSISAKLEDEFRSDLEAYYGVENNPKKDRLYGVAWEQGHSSGFYDVANVYGDLVDLIR